MINKILLIPKDQKILDFNYAGFVPPQAYLVSSSSGPYWERYNPIINEPKNKHLHTFAIIFAWNGKPVYSGLDYFWRVYSSSPFAWPINWNNESKNLKDIVSSLRTFGMKPDSHGEIVIQDHLDQELVWPTLKVK